MPYQWVVKCKDCAKEFTCHLIDEDHPRQAVNGMPAVEPPKPPLRGRAEERMCPHCGGVASYERLDLEFGTT